MTAQRQMIWLAVYISGTSPLFEKLFAALAILSLLDVVNREVETFGAVGPSRETSAVTPDISRLSPGRQLCCATDEIW
jgi:hypothetical protein